MDVAVRGAGDDLHALEIGREDDDVAAGAVGHERNAFHVAHGVAIVARINGAG